MADLKKAIDDLSTKVSGQGTVIEGVTQTLTELKNQVSTVAGDLDEAGETEAAAKLDELAAAIEANTLKLALAIAKNTGANDEVHANQM